MNILLFILVLLLGNLLIVVIDNIFGFHISNYSIAQSVAITLPRMIFGFILGYMVFIR